MYAQTAFPSSLVVYKLSATGHKGVIDDNEKVDVRKPVVM